MKTSARQWFLAVLFLASLAGLAMFVVPSEPLDPWSLINLKKLVWMYFALSLIQFFGALLNYFFGVHAGMLLTGFLAGLMSSTALTVSLAHNSRSSHPQPVVANIGALLAAMLGVLIEAAALMVAADGDILDRSAIILLAPAVLCSGLILLLWGKRKSHLVAPLPSKPIDYVGVLKLTLFIGAALLMANMALQAFGSSGILLTSFLVSLFEVHGSLIASAQMFDRGVIADQTFQLAISLALSASVVSKYFILGFVAERKFALRAFVALSLLLVSIWVGFLLQS